MTRVSNHTCIFCGKRGKLTREHIWANWLSPLLPHADATTHHVRHAHDIQPGKLNRRVNPHSQRLQIVCGPCNSGWMSQLQTQVRPHLEPLVLGNWTPMDLRSQNILASWATMFTMVAERADPETSYSSEIERRLFMITRQPPDDRLVWIGHYADMDHIGALNHFAGRTITRSSRGSFQFSKFQTTAFVVGQLMFLVWKLPIGSLNFNPFLFAHEHSITLILPPSISAHRPRFSHNYRGFDLISSWVARTNKMRSFSYHTESSPSDGARRPTIREN